MGRHGESTGNLPELDWADVILAVAGVMLWLGMLEVHFITLYCVIYYVSYYIYTVAGVRLWHDILFIHPRGSFIVIQFLFFNLFKYIL